MGTRVVYDTNVLVSALGFGGTPLDALLTVFEDDYQLLASEETLEELSRVMAYERLPVIESEREQYVSILRNEADIVSTTPQVNEIVADPDDNIFLECAIGGNADYIVSGDDHLLELRSFRGVEIVTPAVFLERC